MMRKKFMTIDIKSLHHVHEQTRQLLVFSLNSPTITSLMSKSVLVSPPYTPI